MKIKIMTRTIITTAILLFALGEFVKPTQQVFASQSRGDYSSPRSGINPFTDTITLNASGDWEHIQSIPAIADFDQDGYDDLLVSAKPYGQSNSCLKVLLNQYGEGYTTVWNGPCGSGVGLWRAADVNGDGYPDLISQNGHNLEVYINQLSPEFACATDLNKDGETSIHDMLFVLAQWGPCE
jgi:hypothetical protein